MLITGHKDCSNFTNADIASLLENKFIFNEISKEKLVNTLLLGEVDSIVGCSINSSRFNQDLYMSQCIEKLNLFTTLPCDSHITYLIGQNY